MGETGGEGDDQCDGFGLFAPDTAPNNHQTLQSQERQKGLDVHRRIIKPNIVVVQGLFLDLLESAVLIGELDS